MGVCGSIAPLNTTSRSSGVTTRNTRHSSASALDAVVGVEVGPMLEAVRLQPFVLRGSAHEALEIAARVQALSAPVGGRQKRHGHLVPERRARPVIVVVLRVSADLFAKVAAVLI